MRRPVDTFALVGAAAATLVIIINAAFLQSGAHPAPFVANTPAQPAIAEVPPKPPGQSTLKPADLAPARSVIAPPVQQAAAVPLPPPAPVRRNDPIADLIGPSPRILAVQRILSEFGYGQIKSTGVLDDKTSEAIEKFERERKLPVSSRVSDRLIAELNALAGPGHPAE